MSLTPDLIRETLEKAGLLSFFPPESLAPFTRFSQKMLQINETLNLTRWSGEEDFLNFHLLDSAFSLPSLSPLVENSHCWLDLGTGCGFPGAVLAAAFPQAEVTLLDSVAKKTTALDQCFQESGLKGKTLTGRAEDFGRTPRTREAWNGVTARAVADFRVVLEYGIPLLKPGGYLVNWMTEDQIQSVDKAERALQLLQGKIIKKADYSLPGLNQPRFLVIVEKMGKTPVPYPRPVGQASKHPL